MAKILLIEDELKVVNLLRKGLRKADYDVDVALDGVEGYDRIRDNEYDLVILDLMLPKLSGWELIPLIRKFKSNIPLIALTARSAIRDRVQGLRLGCDDYIIKPFSFDELLARIEVAIRCRSSSAVTGLISADLVLDPLQRKVTRRGKTIQLSNKEFLLLEYLLRNLNKVVTRDMILADVWETEMDSSTNVVDVYINLLRKKIDRDFEPQLIHTVRGMGYTLRG
jgi:two-component system copper resistance phosphate regulon response regulator CusR